MNKSIAELQELDREAWSSIYSTELPGPIWHGLPFIDDLVAVFREAGCYKILDAACGDAGQMLCMPEDMLLIGLDQCPVALANAQHNLTDSGRHNFVLCKGFVDKQQFPDASFDGIFFIDTLSCFLQPEWLLAEFKRILKPHGLLITTTFSRSDPIASEVEFFTDFQGFFAGKFITVLYDEESLLSLYAKSGFEVIEISERRDPEAPHPHYREQWHEHARLVVVARAT